MTFLQYVAKDLLAKHGHELTDVAVVFPNKRASIFLNRALYEEAGHPVWSPAYLTISDLFRKHSELQVPDNILLIFKLYNVYCDLVQTDETLDHFYGWGQLLLSDFDDLDKNMADADKLFVNLEALKDMDDFSFLSEQQRKGLETFFGHVVDDTLLQNQFRRIWQHLADIYHTYNRTLRREGLAYEGMLYRDVAGKKDIDFRYKHYVFVGFNLLQKVEQKLFARLKDMGKAEFYWDYDNYYMPPSQQEAGRYIARYLEKFPNELSHERISEGLDADEIYNNMAKEKDVTYISAPTENIQARYISHWLKEKDRYLGGCKTAIVLSDESLLQTVVHCLPEEIKDVNITTGFPLAASQASTFVGSLIDLQLNGRQGGDRFRLKQVNQVLRHPYAKYISLECQALCKELNEHKQFFPQRSFLTEGHDEAVGELFGDIAEENGFWPLLAWVARLLKRAGIGSASTDDPLMHETIYRMYTLINRLDAIMTLSPLTTENASLQHVDPQTGRQIVSISILQKLMGQLLQSASIPFHGEPAKGVQIMGVLETRNLDFDHVLVLSCNEGKLPKGVNDASFIPHSLRAAYELTTVENKVAIYAYYFYSLLQRAKDVTLTYNNATDDGQKGEMSRFMLQYMVENGSAHTLHRLSLKSGQSASIIQRKRIEKGEQILKRLDAIERLSPTAIYRYLRCPLQFYYHTVCKLYEDDNDDENEIDNMTFGNIFHRTAELIYHRLSKNTDRTITADEIRSIYNDRNALYSLIDDAFREILFKVNDANFRPRYNGLQLLNRKVIYIYIRRLLELDIKTAPFAIVALEQDFYDKMTFAVNGKPRTLMIGGQIDRLDRVETGIRHLRVIDYKTGKPLDTPPATVADLFDSSLVESKHTDYYLQAFLYASSIRHGEESSKKANSDNLPVAPALLFIRQTQKKDYNPILSFTGGKRGVRLLVMDIDQHYEEFVDGLKNLLAEIFNPDMPFIPTQQTKRCQTCPYNKICGV